MARSGKYRPGPEGSDTESNREERLSRNANKAARREAARLEMLRAEAAQRRRSRLLMAGAVVVALVVIVGIIVGVGLHSSNSDDDTATGGASTPADATVVKAVSQVPASVFDAVGAGGGAVEAKPTAISGTPLTADGKPRILYVGAEYCPFCAAERWPMVIALSRFGTFSHLGQTTSSARDVYPSTSTLSFHGATYTSQYLSFTGVEQTTNQPQGNGYVPLDTLSAADQQILNQHDSGGTIPFVDFGGKFIVSGASYDPKVLQGKSHDQIAQALSDPSNDITKAVIGTANTLTAGICQLTNQKPASVCTSAGVRAAA